jgi:hypothetical protein
MDRQLENVLLTIDWLTIEDEIYKTAHAACALYAKQQNEGRADAVSQISIITDPCCGCHTIVDFENLRHAARHIARCKVTTGITEYNCDPGDFQTYRFCTFDHHNAELTKVDLDDDAVESAVYDLLEPALERVVTRLLQDRVPAVLNIEPCIWISTNTVGNWSGVLRQVDTSSWSIEKVIVKRRVLE